MIPLHNIYGTLIPNELNEDGLKLADAKSKYTFCTYAITQHILLQISSARKIAFFEELFLDVKDHTYMLMTFQLMNKYFMGKRIAYLYTLDSTDYDLDITAIDNDRSMDAEEVEHCLIETKRWFKYLDNIDLKLGIFISFLSISGNNTIRQVILKIKQHYKQQQVSRQTNSILHGILDLTNSLKTSVDDYIEDYDVNDPDVQLIYKKRNEWKNEMAKYRKKVEESINADAEKKTPATGKEGKKQKSKKGTTKKKNVRSKNETKSKKEVKGAIEIDFLQLLPIWITMKIFKYLDEKTLKAIKNVNNYWEFIVTSLNQDDKIRKKLDTFIDSMKKEYHLHNTLPIFPPTVKREYRFLRRDKPIIACDPKVTTALNYSKRFKMQTNNESLLCKVANNQLSFFQLPASNLTPFVRKVPVDYPKDATKYLHQRPKCTTFNNLITNRLPISDIPFFNESLGELDFPQLISVPSINSTIMQDLIQLHVKTIHSTKKPSKLVNRVIHRNSKKSEVEHLMSKVLRKSIHQIERYRKSSSLKELRYNLLETQRKALGLKNKKQDEILLVDNIETEILHVGESKKDEI